MTGVENIDSNILYNISGAEFQKTAHWQILTSDDNRLVQDNLTDTYVFQFYSHIASGVAREENLNIEATKLSYKENNTT